MNKVSQATKDQGILRWSYFLHCAYAGIRTINHTPREIRDCAFCKEFEVENCPLSKIRNCDNFVRKCCNGIYSDWRYAPNGTDEQIEAAEKILEMIEAVEVA